MTLLHHLPPPPLMLLFLTGLYLSCRKWRCQCCVRRDIRRGEHTVLHQVDDTGRGFFWRHCDCVQVCHVRGRRRRARGSHLKLIHPFLTLGTDSAMQLHLRPAHHISTSTASADITIQARHYASARSAPETTRSQPNAADRSRHLTIQK